MKRNANTKAKRRINLSFYALANGMHWRVKGHGTRMETKEGV